MKRHAKALVAVVIACLVLGASTAFALNGHAPSPSNPFLSSLSNPQALAVDQSNGDLYVLDTGDSTVKRFDSAGAPAEFSALGSNVIEGTTTPQGGFSFGSPAGAQIAIDRSGGSTDGYLYVTNTFNGAVNVFDNTGAYKGRLPNPGGEPCGVAVDGSGNVYVSNQGFGRIYKYAPAEDPADVVLERQIFETYGQCQIAVDSSENLYSVSNGGGEVRRYASSEFGKAEPTYSTFAPFATAINRDPSSEDLYLDEGTQIARYSSAGSLIQRFGSSELSESAGVAIHSETSTVYGSDSSDGQVSAFVPALLPDATTEAATAVTGTSATLNGTIDPAGGPEASCEFRWGTEAGSYPNTAPCTPAGPFTEATAASAEISGLEEGTVYHFQIVAANAEGENTGADRAFTTVGAPLVSGLSVSDVGTGSAVLHGTIDPAGEDTDYRFEYVELGEFEANGFDNATSAPVPDGTVAAGPAQQISQEIEGLEEQTAYRYRLTATNQAGTATTDSQTLTTHRPAGEFSLPEGRAWEMVSPVEKEGVDVRIDPGRTRALAEGDRIAYTAMRPFGDAQGSSLTADFMAERGSGGWKTHSLMPKLGPQGASDVTTQFTARYVGEMSPDGETGVFTSHSPLTDGPDNAAGLRNFYLRRDLGTPGTGSWELLSDPVEPLTAPAQYVPAYAGASEDFSHVVFGARVNLTGTLPTPGGAGAQNAFCLAGSNNNCEPRLFEHTPEGLRLVGMVPPNLSEASCSGSGCLSAIRSIARGSSLIAYPQWVISEDGRRIFFTVGISRSVEIGSLWVREDGERTYRVDASEKDPPVQLPSSVTQSAFTVTSADGSKAFFFTRGQLLDEDTDSEKDLYRYDLDQPEGSRLILISTDTEPSDRPSTIEEVYGASDDGEYVYFKATNQLVEGDPIPEPDQPLVFMWHAGELRTVGPVTSSALDQANGSENWAILSRAARVTSDGSKLLFTSHVAGSSAGADCPITPVGKRSEPCGRAFLYDAAANGGQGQLHCASCPPDGSPARAEASWTPRVGMGGSSSDGHINQALSEDGRFAFFSTGDSLVPEDSNGRYDVYAYDTTIGEARLLSSGSCNCDSWFVDASPDGSDVFFGTREQLVGWDTDNLMDIYDARVGGGFPEPPAPPPSCAGDACQPPPLALNDQTPASSAFEGAGNPKTKPKARRCGKNKHRAKVNGKSRCVKNKGRRAGTSRANDDRRASR